MSQPLSPSDLQHIRPIHLRTDINEVADLVERCFADHMDAEGHMYLQNIRRVGREGDPYHLDAISPETSPVPFHGFVWVENERIVGNITLIYLKKKDRNIYFIANVAVDPEYREKGIARKLTQRALTHVREHNGKLVMLQVREDNPVAIHLYESLGFYEITRRTNWGFDHRPQNLKRTQPQSIKVIVRNKDHWLQQKEWLEQIYPEKVTWFLPFQLAKHEPGLINWFYRWLNSDSIQFFEANDGERLIGLASLEMINPFQDYLWIATSPAFEELAIPALVSAFVRRSRHPQKILINYPAHRAIASFQSLEMIELNTLIWMENSISIADGHRN
ncbi:MAG: GNAT family N-acetyltransferase [Anaerolineaceae bacterium]